MTPENYDSQKIDHAVETFENSGLSAAEALMASVKLMVKSLARFRAEAPAFREEIGEERIREFAMVEMNELVYEIQDSVPIAVRMFNSLMRDKDAAPGRSGGPPGE